MAKAIFGEFAAFNTQGGIRYMKNNKWTSEKFLPPEVVAYLKKNLGVVEENVQPPATLPPRKFAPPTEEEKAKLRAESLQTPPELQRTPEEMDAATPTPVDDIPLTENDFDVPPAPTPVPADPISPVSPTPTPVSESPIPPMDAVDEPIEPVPAVDPDFLEQVSIHTADIRDIAQALYERFGLYSVYLDKLPEADEFNPLTGEQFTKYHLGIAYQAAIRAKNQGIVNRPAESGRAAINEGRVASENFQVDTPPATVGEARRLNTFEHRTSPHGTREEPRTEIIHVQGADGQLHAEQRVIPEGQTGEFNGATARYDKEEDEPLVQPNFSGRPVIRPNW